MTASHGVLPISSGPPITTPTAAWSWRWDPAEPINIRGWLLEQEPPGWDWLGAEPRILGGPA